MGKYLSDACLQSAEAIADLDDVAKALPPEDIKHTVNQALGRVGKMATVREKFISSIINGMLSGTMTPIANSASVALQGLMQTATYSIGAITDKLGVTAGDRALRDVGAMISSALDGFAADLVYFKAGWETGNPLDIRDSVASMAKASGKTTSQVKDSVLNKLGADYAIARRKNGDTRTDKELVEEYKVNLKRTQTEDKVIEEFFGENYDYIRNVWGPSMDWVNIPTKLSVAVDEYGKARFRRMKIAEMASRKARKDADEGKGSYAELYKTYQQQSLDGVGRDGGTSYRAIQKDFATLENNLARVFGVTEDDMMPYQTMKDFALDKTFQSKLHGTIKGISDFRNKSPAGSVAMAFFIPFIKTPWNIVKDSATYIPGVGIDKWTRPAYVRGTQVAKMSKDELLPRQVLGASVFAGVLMMFENGMITGNPRSSQERQQWQDEGKPARSIKIGDQWVSYERFEPIATGLGLMADFIDTGANYIENPDPDKSLPDSLVESLYALKENITSKTFLKGLATVFDFLESPDKGSVQQVAGTLLSPLVPAAVNEAARIQEAFGDNVARQSTNALERVQKRVPYFRSKLPADYGAYGGARKENIVQAITGVNTSDEATRTAVQRAVEESGAKINRPQDSFKGVDIDSKQLSVFRQLANEQTTKFLERMIASPMYQSAPKRRQAFLLEDAARKARRIAGGQFLQYLRKEDPDFFRKRKNIMIMSKGLDEMLGLTSAQ